MSAASWPPPATFLANRPLFMHQMQLNGPAVTQAAWLELSHSFRELSKLVDHMACAPTAEQFYTIYNHHSALFAKLEDLEPSQEGFGIPGPPSRANLPEPVSYDTAVYQQHPEEAVGSSPMVHQAHHQASHELHHRTPLPPQSQTILPHQQPQAHPHLMHGKPAAHPMAPPRGHPAHGFRKQPTRYAHPSQAQQPGGPFISYLPAHAVAHQTVRPPPMPYPVEDQLYTGHEALVPAAVPQPAPTAALPAAAGERVKRKPTSRRVPISRGSPSSESIGTPEEDSESDERHHKKKKNRRKEKRNPMHRDMACHQCGVRETPEWRRGPDGSHTLCNACGLRFSKLMRKKGEEEVTAEPTPQATPTHMSGEVGVLSEQLELPVPEEVPYPGETPPFGTNA